MEIGKIKMKLSADLVNETATLVAFVNQSECVCIENLKSICDWSLKI